MRVNEIKINAYNSNRTRYNTNVLKSRVLKEQTLDKTTFGDSFENSKGDIKVPQTPFWSKVTNAVGSFWKGGENINIPFDSVLYYPY